LGSGADGGGEASITVRCSGLPGRQHRAGSPQSMMSAQASVGAAATCPTSGTIFKPADATRHGAATTPQPERRAAPSRAATSRRRFIVRTFDWNVAQCGTESRAHLCAFVSGNDNPPRRPQRLCDAERCNNRGGSFSAQRWLLLKKSHDWFAQTKPPSLAVSHQTTAGAGFPVIPDITTINCLSRHLLSEQARLR